jgi:AcrR family transcriptional regulator
MPRAADPDLERRILDAAQQLWVQGGDKALTMRAVARAAGTTTPTLYERFQNRQDILRGVMLRIRDGVIHMLDLANSPEEMCEKYLHWGLHHPHEYELFFTHSYDIFGPAQRGTKSFPEAYPGRELTRRRLAEFLGGSPEDHTELHLALWATLHGAIMLLNSKTVHGTHVRELKQSCLAAVKLILRHRASFNEKVAAEKRTNFPGTPVPNP